MEDDDIIEPMLYKLDGWILDNNENKDLLPTKYNKKVTEEELLHFYDVAMDYALSYTQQEDLGCCSVYETALILWASGLIWNKYDIRVNNQEDDTNTLGYGDKLIVQAKEMLKPYKAYSFTAY